MSAVTDEYSLIMDISWVGWGMKKSNNIEIKNGRN